MSIQSHIFWMMFLPLFLLIYFRVPDQKKHLCITVFSLIFLGFQSLFHTMLFLILLLANLFIGQEIDRCAPQAKRRKILLAAGVSLDAAVLIFYKYIGLFSEQLQIKVHPNSVTALLMFPLGLSFFIFKAISFLADVYSGKYAVSRDDYSEAAAYLLFFGQFHSGPISRISDMALVPRTERRTLFTEGVRRYLIGFSKKILLADVLSRITTEIFDKSELKGLSAAYVWLGAVCWSLELYYDFAGYSDMAAGISYMFGFRCPENFIYPYAAESVSGFWRRWHASLGAWFRDYVYIPLGGSRTKQKLGTYRNLLAVWLLTGFWHGISLNFIVWGIGHCLLIMTEKAAGIPKRLHSAAKILWRIVVLLAAVLLWVIFRCTDLRDGLYCISVMFGFGEQDPLSVYRTKLLIGDYLVFLIAAVIFAAPVIPMLKQKITQSKKGTVLWNVLSPAAVIGMFLLSVLLTVYNSNNPFVYAGF